MIIWKLSPKTSDEKRFGYSGRFETWSKDIQSNFNLSGRYGQNVHRINPCSSIPREKFGIQTTWKSFGVVKANRSAWARSSNTEWY